MKDLNSDSSDSDYVPSQSSKSSKRKQKLNVSFSNKEKINNIWLEMNNNSNISENRMKIEIDPLQFAKNLIEKNERDTLEGSRTVIFAGSQYLIDKNGNLKLKNKENLSKIEKEIQDFDKIQKENKSNFEIKNKSEHIIEKIIQKQKYLKLVLEKINTKSKNLNSIGKSKIDWENFARKQKLEQRLAQNRKNGFLDKKKFLKNTENKK